MSFVNWKVPELFFFLNNLFHAWQRKEIQKTPFSASIVLPIKGSIVLGHTNKQIMTMTFIMTIKVSCIFKLTGLFGIWHNIYQVNLCNSVFFWENRNLSRLSYFRFFFCNFVIFNLENSIFPSFSMSYKRKFSVGILIELTMLFKYKWTNELHKQYTLETWYIVCIIYHHRRLMTTQ